MTPIPASAAAVADAARRLAAGALVAFPTETVYGLGADASSPEAVARIFAAKGRPLFNPLIAHLASAEAAAREGVFTQNAERLAAAFWPGPLTLVLPRRPGGTVCDLACAGLASVALRVPRHPVALALIAAAGCPVAAPSANPSGRLSPTRAPDVAAELGEAVDLVLDGGACPVGVESTVVACLDGTAALQCGVAASRRGVPGLRRATGERIDGPAGRGDARPVALGRPRRGRGQPLQPSARPRRDAAPARRDRGGPGARPRPRRGDQRPPASRGGAAALSDPGVRSATGRCGARFGVGSGAAS